MKTRFTLVAASIAAFVAGCSTGPASRIEEKAAVYRGLTPEQQQRITHGVIQRGDTKDMVYMALGRPSETEPADAATGALEKWTYRNFYPSEQLAPESLYRKPGRGSSPARTGSVDALGGMGLATDASSHGGYVEGSGRSTGSGGGGQADVSAATMEVWFRRNRVASFTLTP